MGLLTKEVEVVVNSRNVKYYEDLGYDIPKYYNKNKKKDVYIRGSKIRVDVNDLPVGSHYRVECECEVCKGHSSMSWQTYMECNHDGKTYCKHCASKFFLSGKTVLVGNLTKRMKREKTTGHIQSITYLLNPFLLVIIILVNVVIKAVLNW